MTNLFLVGTLTARGQISKLLFPSSLWIIIIVRIMTVIIFLVIMITKPAYRRLCTLTFSKSVFVGFRYSPRSDEKRLTSRNSVAYSSFPRSSKL